VGGDQPTEGISVSEREVVVVEAVRTPVGKRRGGLSAMHAIDLLAAALQELMERSGVDPAEVGQVVGGCVGQVGMQALNVTRTAWLNAGLPLQVAATTVDAQCGSSQQATQLAYSMVAAGVVDVAVGCGVEIMSRIPLGANVPRDPDLGRPVNRRYRERYELTTQFEGAERIAEQRGITRTDCDAFGKLSQDQAARAWAEDRFRSQIVPVNAPDLGDDGKPAPTTHLVNRDEGLRDTSLEALSALKPTGRPDGVHTAGTSSQISDGAGAVLLMTKAQAERLGLTPKATVVDVCLVGSDPVLMLEGPIPATRKLLADNKLRVEDIGVFEINEAFASVVLAWEQELKPDPDRVNPNGGAIALGHPVGATGAILITKAVHEMERSDLDLGIVTMCCGGGLGTGTLLRRT
jgi:acetyl-CoA C-acetyltransferase